MTKNPRKGMIQMIAKNAKQMTWIRLTTVALAALMVLSVAVAVALSLRPDTASADGLKKLEGVIHDNREQYLDGSLIYKLPETVAEDDEISVIVEVKEKSLLEHYKDVEGMPFTEYAFTDEADAVRARIKAEKQALLAAFDKAELKYTAGAEYEAVLSGFEVIIKAGDFETLCKTVGDRGNPIVGEVYKMEDTTAGETDAGTTAGTGSSGGNGSTPDADEAPKTNDNKLVENIVNVYDTGIFNSSGFGYDGSGTVIAVLDTGLDYYHSAFSVSNFGSKKWGLTFDEVAALVGDTRAEGMQNGLTASDVYINEKIPFAFDYADGDSDVYPIASDHGTHVAGVIAGKDDVITGVAPNAQLVIMKTFSDILSTARTAWIMSALDDCVVLGVDVINMSLGTDCGFSRERDKEAVWGVYDRIREAGISVVAAASNSFNSTYGSEKNGNLGLTSNPDSSTVGSPSTYKGSLSVGSISGTKTPYILYNGQIIYFLESADRVSEDKNFYDDLLGEKQEMEIEYITIPGAGRSADYTGIDVTGKLVLVARGATTFEEKANVAQQKGALGIIIYNNVSGDIKMNVGDATLAVASIRQDDGEMLAAAKTGKLMIKRSQTSGPFMSDFSSWGPTPDLQIKPEITAHGGEIYSAVPGQSYDHMSGTSMATPNMSGVVALLRQFIVEEHPEMANDPVAVTAFVNQLLMSTADIVYNTNGLPYSVRKQGAGLANLQSAGATTAFLQTYDRLTGAIMDKSKIELGDDPEKTGVYTLKLGVKNFGATTLSYDVAAYVMTEGVSDTKTNDGKTTVTQQGYILDGAVVSVKCLSGGAISGNTVTVEGGKTAELEITITLSDADKKYLDASFANGMYVEGFVKLTAKSGTTVNLSAPYLAFYGDWTQAPIFDLDYYATNADELDDSIDLLDKTLPDAYATRPIGRVENDYVSYMGSYYFVQDPAAKKIAADRKYISVSNQEGAVNSVEYVWAGLLRNNKMITITVTDDATGEVVYERTEKDIRKSFSTGTTITPANIDVKFSAIEQNLKNNTRYTVTLNAYLDYDRDGRGTNLNNTFTFPVVTDFESPAITDVEYYTEYDRAAEKNRLYAKISIYDNHYSMCLQMGYAKKTVVDGVPTYEVVGFDKYMTPIYAEGNSSTTVIYELTDHIDEIREEAARGNTLTIAVYDFALNQAMYEIPLPDSYTDFYFTETELTLSPNELYDLKPMVYPATEWPELLEYYSTNMNVANVVGDKLVAIAPGVTQIVARDPITKKTASFKLTVRGEGDEGYVRYDKPVAENFFLTGYYVDKAYYMLNSDDRDVGITGDEQKFIGSNYSLAMYPSEAVTLRYRLDAYFPNATEVVFESSNKNIVTVDENGKITAKAEGFASISLKVLMDGQSTFYSQSISIEVKDPYITTGPSLTHYFGLGGIVTIPDTLAITDIGQYAFTNFDYIPKDPAIDEISEDFPELSKLAPKGEGQEITEVIIPEGVKTIGAYAFADMKALTRVVLPSTLERIDQGAFYGCTALKEVAYKNPTTGQIESYNFGNVKFINQRAFENCGLTGNIRLNQVVAIADYSFLNCTKLQGVTLSTGTQSVGAYAFSGAKALKSVEIPAEKIKLGRYAFSGCEALEAISLNVSVVPAGAFNGCRALTSVTLGKDVAVIAEYAFGGTAVNAFTVADGNTNLMAQSGKPYLLNAAGDTLVLVAPGIKGAFELTDKKVTAIGTGAFSGNTEITSVQMPQVTKVGSYAFAGCKNLVDITLGKLSEFANHAFYNAGIQVAPSFEKNTVIGDYAFAGSKLEVVDIADGMTIGAGAFRECRFLARVTIGNDVTIGANAFRLDYANGSLSAGVEKRPVKGEDVSFYFYILTSPMEELTIGKNAVIGDGAFYGAAEITDITLGEGAVIGDRAFYNTASLTGIDLSAVQSIGEEAFSGDVLYEFSNDPTAPGVSPVVALDEDGNYAYHYYAPALASVDLTAADSIGKLAFAYCRELENVKLGKKITSIPDSAFMMAEKLSNINLDGIRSIGSNAFNDAALTSVALPAAETIGTYAFVYCDQLVSVTLNAKGTRIEEGAFSYNEKLTTVENFHKVTSIGDYAFAYTDIREADLSAAAAIGTHAFLKETATDFTVTLGSALCELGDNPFAFCRLSAFTDQVTETFGENQYSTEVKTFSISDTVRVIDGHLYRVVPHGLEMIAYAGTDKIVTVAENTVRISDMTFAGSPVTHAIMPYTLKSIGHKAFFDCDKLSMITLSSYVAPVLEEMYDVELFNSKEHIAATGSYAYYDVDGSEIIYDGLGIIPFFMWNAGDLPQNVYYGANFVDYVGKTDKDLVLVAPMNGREYHSFIFGQYFGTYVDGAAAADDMTLAAIAAIDRLPDTVSLADKPLVEAARAAYNLVVNKEQQALVTNYSKLETAEKRISDLEYLQGDSTETTPGDSAPEETETGTETETEIETGEETTKAKDGNGDTLALGIIVLLLVAAASVFAGMYIGKKR